MTKAIKLITLFFLLIIPSNSSGEELFQDPDFAFPQTVCTNARTILTNADRMSPEQAGPVRLRALLELAVATNSIDEDSLGSILPLINEQAEKTANKADRAMLITLEASILHTIYDNSRWVYNRVNAPALPIPDKISLWGRIHFENRITELCDSALVLISEVESTPITRYDASLEYTINTIIYIPDAESFIRKKAIDFCSSFVQSDRRDQLISDAISISSGPQRIYWLLTRDKDNAKALLADYNEYKDDCAARLLLLNYIDAPISYNSNDGINAKLQTLALLRESLEKFPDWSDNAEFRDKIAILTTPKANFDCPSYCAPGLPAEISVNYEFANELSVDIYRIPDDAVLSSKESVKSYPRISSIILRPDNTFGHKKLTFTPDAPGRYAMIGHINGKANNSFMELIASPIMPVVISGTTKTAIITTDFVTGAPKSGVKVNATKSNWRRQERQAQLIGRTDSKGLITTEFPRLSEKYNFYTLSFNTGGHNFDFDDDLRVSSFSPYLKSEGLKARIMTDRALYHQGDSVQWAIIVANKDGINVDAVENFSSVVTLTDTNDEIVDSTCIKTDGFGRAFGSFKIPQDRLTGTYQLRLFRGAQEIIRATDITVSDFRLPTIYAEITAIRRNAPAVGDVTINGRVRTYSGLPVAAASISAEISGMNFWRWFTPASSIATLNTTSEADGSFEIIVPASTLNVSENSDTEYTFFQAEITATSPNAETAICRRNFNTGKPYVISAEFPGKADGCKSNTAIINALDANSSNSPIELRWEIGLCDDSEKALKSVILSGYATAGTPFALDFNDIPAGVYSIRICPTDTTLANESFIPNAITIYNTARSLIPDTGEPFFVPKDSYTFVDGTARVCVAIEQDGTSLYTALRKGEKLIKVEQQSHARAYIYINIDSRDIAAGQNAELILLAVRNGEVYSQSVSLNLPAEPEVKLTAETFRDKLIPGETETWRFRLVRNGIVVPEAAMIATMYNGALEALDGYSLPSPFSFAEPQYRLNINKLNIGSDGCFANIYPRLENNSNSWEWPDWRYFDENSNSIRAFGIMYSAAPKGSANIRETLDEGSSMLEYAISEEAAEDEASEAAIATPKPGNAPEVKYRDGEALQAFFMPSLVADRVGNIDVVFTVPNANGAWNFASIAWSKAMRMSQLKLTATAAKPVMVQPNLPRFLRQGDTARIGATIFNNSDTTTNVNATVEIFDINTGATTETHTFSKTIAPQGSSIVAIDVTAPSDVAAIGYRIRANAANFTDGEQNAIPVLSSSATVIESNEFYLNPGAEPYSLSLPANDSTSYTLQYCSNPIWTVVKAMRGLSANTSVSSNLLAGRLYSALAARSITAANPEIESAFRTWQNNPHDGALTSMLDRNSNLKSLILDQTPWVQASKNESERMAALAKVFDNSEVTTNINNSINALAELQHHNGGFAWTSWSNTPSVWSTSTVLLTLGLARSMDMLGNDAERINKLCSKAFNYIQSEAADELRRNNNAVDLSFAVICALWQDFEISTEGNKLIDNTINNIIKNWRRFSTYDKAWAIIVLKNKGLTDTAGLILESLRQFGVYRPGKGLCFPSVDDIRCYATIIQAFAAMDAPRNELDAMRQWITVQAQVSDNLGAYNPDYIIAAVMLTGTNWTVAPHAFGVLVDGKPLTTTESERATGYIVSSLTPSGSHLNIEIRPNGETPSYGSIVSIGSRRQDTVAARPSDDLAISKRFLIEQDGKWIETDTFALGQRIRVQLIVEAGRSMEYVAITDRRPAAFEPVDQLPGYIYDGSLFMYRENSDTQTNLFVSYLPKGTYHLIYDMTANNAGSFTSGIATIQSQYAPELTAHSAGTRIKVE